MTGDVEANVEIVAEPNAEGEVDLSEVVVWLEDVIAVIEGDGAPDLDVVRTLEGDRDAPGEREMVFSIVVEAVIEAPEEVVGTAEPVLSSVLRGDAELVERPDVDSDGNDDVDADGTEEELGELPVEADKDETLVLEAEPIAEGDTDTFAELVTELDGRAVDDSDARGDADGATDSVSTLEGEGAPDGDSEPSAEAEPIAEGDTDTFAELVTELDERAVDDSDARGDADGATDSVRTLEGDGAPEADSEPIVENEAGADCELDRTGVTERLAPGLELADTDADAVTEADSTADDDSVAVAVAVADAVAVRLLVDDAVSVALEDSDAV